ncbi:MAG: hypothetical protein KC502_01710 [Myxococcales bacterium]|nr:hypothetical protein [Myxococcales bacterium]
MKKLGDVGFVSWLGAPLLAVMVGGMALFGCGGGDADAPAKSDDTAISDSGETHADAADNNDAGSDTMEADVGTTDTESGSLKDGTTGDSGSSTGALDGGSTADALPDALASDGNTMDAVAAADSATADAATTDAAKTDAATSDTGPIDAGPADAGATDGGNLDAVAGTPVPPADKTVLSWLQAKHYTKWQGESKVHKSTGPHEYTRTWVNPVLAKSLAAKAKSHPPGSIAVKELRAGLNSPLKGWAFLIKPVGGSGKWYFYESLATDGSGTIYDNPSFCVGCHKSGNDHFMSPWPLQ